MDKRSRKTARAATDLLENAGHASLPDSCSKHGLENESILGSIRDRASAVGHPRRPRPSPEIQSKVAVSRVGRCQCLNAANGMIIKPGSQNQNDPRRYAIFPDHTAPNRR